MAFIMENFAVLISAWSLFLLLAGFLYGFRRAKERVIAAAEEGKRARSALLPPLSAQARSRVEEALRNGDKAGAIKLMREETGLDLAEAEAAVEALGR